MTTNFNPNINDVVQGFLDQIKGALPVQEFPGINSFSGAKEGLKLQGFENNLPKTAGVENNLPYNPAFESSPIQTALENMSNAPDVATGPLPFNNCSHIPAGNLPRWQKFIPKAFFELSSPAKPPFKKVLSDFLNNPHNKFVEERLAHQLDYVKKALPISDQVRKNLDEVRNYLGFYPKKFNLPEVKNFSSDYFNIDPVKFAEKVYEEMPPNFILLSKTEQELLYEDKARELAPVHPAVLEYVSEEITQDKNAALLLSKMVDGVHEKLEILLDEDKLDLLEKGDEIESLLNEGIFKEPDWVLSVLEDLGEQVEGLKPSTQERLKEVERDIRLGRMTVNGMIKAKDLNPKATFLDVGKAIFGVAFRMPLAFELKDAFLNYKKDKLIEQGVMDRAVPLKNNFLFEKVQSWMVYNSISSLESDNFNYEEFLVESKVFTSGCTELANGRIFSANGIATHETDSREGAKMLSEMAGGAKVTGIYNATHSYSSDLKECILHTLYVNTKPVSLLVEEISDYFEKEGLDKRILINCHSQGAIITRNALVQLPPEIRKRVSVLAVAPGAYIDRYLCGSVIHLVSSRDWLVPYIDRPGRERCKDTIIELKSKAPWWHLMDHSYKSPTYAPFIRQLNQNFYSENK